MPNGMRMRREMSPCVQLTTRPTTNSEWGTRMSTLSLVEIEGRADVDVPHLAVQARLQLDEVADPHAALEEQDDAGDEVAEDRLQAEAETDAEGAGQHREAAGRDAEEAQRQHHPDAVQRVG